MPQRRNKTMARRVYARYRLFAGAALLLQISRSGRLAASHGCGWCRVAALVAAVWRRGA